MVYAKSGKQIECIMGDSKSDNTKFCSFCILEKKIANIITSLQKKKEIQYQVCFPHQY